MSQFPLHFHKICFYGACHTVHASDFILSGLNILKYNHVKLLLWSFQIRFPSFIFNFFNHFFLSYFKGKIYIMLLHALHEFNANGKN